MAIIKTKGIITKEYSSGDFDKVLTILTPDLGQITCYAKGARRPKSSLLAGTGLFAFSDIILYKGSGTTYKLSSCETIEVFYNLRIDLDKLNTAINITQIINDVTHENQQDYKILQLYLNTLYMLSETDRDYNFILSVFKIRLLCLLGYTPKIDNCCNCNNKDIVAFSIRDNGVKCEICSKLDKSCLTLSKDTILALKYIVMSPPKKIYNFKVNNETKKELELMSKIYLNEKLEKTYN